MRSSSVWRYGYCRSTAAATYFKTNAARKTHDASNKRNSRMSCRSIVLPATVTVPRAPCALAGYCFSTIRTAYSRSSHRNSLSRCRSRSRMSVKLSLKWS
jgi:hypothetical protein